MRISLAEQVLPMAVQSNIERNISSKLRYRASGKGLCCVKTARERRTLIRFMIAQLWTLGYKIKKLESLSQKHIHALTDHWTKEGLSAEALHNRMTVLRTLCQWLSKEHVIRHTNYYFPREKTRRQTATDVDKSWQANHLDPAKVIEVAKQIDERFAIMLAMQFHFGLRVKESIEFKPGSSLVNNGTAIELFEGTKGGRPRQVNIETEEQKQTIEWARSVTTSGNTRRIRWPGYTFKKAYSRFYYLMGKMDLTKSTNNVTAHGLRHGYAHDKYRRESGYPAPIQNRSAGRLVAPPSLTWAAHYKASIATTKALGHGRVDVTPAYYGTYGYTLRDRMNKDTSFSENLYPNVA